MLGFPDTGGLFDNFEVNREPFWPKVAYLVAVSAAWHALVITCIAIIPPVRDALNIAVLFSGAGFVDRPYDKTEILNEGDIVDLATEKFRYPDGYFAMDQLGIPNPTPTPRAPAVFTPQPVSPAQMLSPSPTVTPLPISSPSPVITANASPSPLSAEDEKAKQKIEDELNKLAADNGVKRPREINTRPFKDLLADAKKKKDQKELDLSGQIELTVEADRGEDGKLHNAKVSDKRGDKKLEAVALDFVAALSDSNVLDFLEGTSHLKLIAKLDDKNVEIVVMTEVESEARARQMERAYNGMIVLGRIVKRGQDEETYYNHTEVNSHEKEVSVKFSISRDQMGQMLSKYTTEAK